MNKKCLIAAMAAALTLTTGVVMANPVELDGSVSFRYRADETKGDFVTPSKNGKHDGNIVKLILNAKSEIDPNFSAYARLGVIGLTGIVGRDSGEKGDFVTAIDQFGVLYKNAGFSYKIGRQSATVGATALLYNNNYMIGKSSFVDGVSVKGMSGITTLDAIAAQEDNFGDSEDGKIYALHGSYSPAQNWVVGATLGKYDAAAGSIATSTTNYAVDAAYTMGKATIFGEFLKSDANNDNKSYDLGVSYAFDKKNSAYIINYKNEALADMGGRTDFENDFKGFYYGFDHKFTSDTSASLFYRDMESLSIPGKENTSFRATVNYSF